MIHLFLRIQSDEQLKKLFLEMIETDRDVNTLGETYLFSALYNIVPANIIDKSIIQVTDTVYKKVEEKRISQVSTQSLMFDKPSHLQCYFKSTNPPAIKRIGRSGNL